MDDRSPIDLMQPDMLQKLDKFMKPLIRPFVYKWAKTQVILLQHCSETAAASGGLHCTVSGRNPAIPRSSTSG